MPRKSPARRLAIVLLPIGLLYGAAGARYASKCGVKRSSCLEHRQAGCTIDGEYNITWGAGSIDATCDMTTDGGGWTLVGNYLHKSGTGGELTPLQNRLPLQDSMRLGKDERGSKTAWGHASVGVLGGLPIHEYRFTCETNAHERRLDFKLASKPCMDYFRTGRGACLGTPELRAEFRAAVRALEHHDGRLLLTADKGWDNQGDNAMFIHPFFSTGRESWMAGERWECDDSQSLGRQDTHHQVWIR